MGKVLITGATGFIGNHVTRMAVEAGDEVRAMVMPGEDRSPLVSTREKCPMSEKTATCEPRAHPDF